MREALWSAAARRRFHFVCGGTGQKAAASRRTPKHAVACKKKNILFFREFPACKRVCLWHDRGKKFFSERQPSEAKVTLE